MKKLADISSFESLGNNNTAFVNNSSTRIRVKNGIFSKGADGDIDRALLKRRGVALVKEGVGILAQLGIRGSVLFPLLLGSFADAASRIPLAVSESIYGRGPREDCVNRIPAKIAETGHKIRELTRKFPNALDDISDQARNWADEDKEIIGRLRAIKKKERWYNK